MRRTAVFILLILGLSLSASGQINFSQYADYGLKVANTPSSLNFDDVGPIIANGSTYSLDVYNNSSIVEIVGVKYLDIFITVNGPRNLTYVDSGGTTHTIDFTLKSAYRNTKGDPSDPTAGPLKYITNINNDSFTIRVPILERQHQPPGPPPSIPTENTNLTLDASNPLYETLYLYLYGDIFVPDNAAAGSYTGNISITISYD